MDKPIRIALFGIGKMGQNHLRILSMLKDVEIAFLYDTNEELSSVMSERFGVKILKDIDEDLKSCDGAIIVTPTFTHFDYINKVSDYVKNIFVEKPLTNTLESTQIILTLAKEKSLNIQVGFIERYNPAVATLKNILTHNTHKIINIDFIRTNKMSSRITDCDVVIDLMIHDIDLALNFNGDVRDIYAHGVVMNDMIEYARACIIHTNGSFSNIVASRITEKRRRQISITTDSEYIDCNLLRKEVFVDKQSVEQRLDNVSISANTETIEVRGQESLLSELIDFVNLCKNISPQAKSNRPNQNDGMKAMQIAHQIQDIIHSANK
ncbi:Gfo/Idh/MocA family oxidoreductase [Helicobacter sp. MIT 21-1697]|uniref:Gfo/Idh/MocA family protein n=1 Tax=Helicobacter sp. MIT 21-1697 TaxID=2993733 RepID=UPI00224AA63E|nr:Gfo/Idh/MocA family oxidoreductase [Helicobacter sp. MIT 21-1697]MCX2716238.1 Gfo/Idh/MocA family oxidoreductase [Helicobacter sp. MIT 21-1697]